MKSLTEAATRAAAQAPTKPATPTLPGQPLIRPGKNDVVPFRRRPNPPIKPAPKDSPPPSKRPAPKDSPPPSKKPAPPSKRPDPPSKPGKAPFNPSKPGKAPFNPSKPGKAPFNPNKPRNKPPFRNPVKRPVWNPPSKIPAPERIVTPKRTPRPGGLPIPQKTPRPGRVPFPLPRKFPMPRPTRPGIPIPFDDPLFPDSVTDDSFENLPPEAQRVIRDFQRQQQGLPPASNQGRRKSLKEKLNGPFQCMTSVYITFGLSTIDGITGEPVYVQANAFGLLYVPWWSSELNTLLKQRVSEIIDNYVSSGWSIDDYEFSTDGDCVNQTSPETGLMPDIDHEIDHEIDTDDDREKDDDDEMICRYSAALDKQILELLRVVDNLQCEVDLLSSNQRGLKGVVQKILRCGGDAAAIIPESWQIKSDAVRHLVVKWRRVMPDGSLSSKYQTTTAIPFYRHNESFTPTFTDRTLGKVCAVLRDIGAGANLVVYGLNKQTSIQTLQECKSLIDPSKINDPESITISETAAKFGNHTYRAYKIYFFEAGWHGESIKAATWSKKL